MDPSNKKTSDCSEEARQPSVASTVLLTEFRGSVDRMKDFEEGAVGGGSPEGGPLGPPLGESSPTLARDSQRSEHLECLVDPGAFTGNVPDVELDVIMTGDENLLQETDDIASVADSVKSIGGKRRRPAILSDSDGDDDSVSDLGMARRLRARKTRIIESSVERDVDCPDDRPKAVSPVCTSAAGETDSAAQTTVDSDGNTLSEKKKKPSKRSPILQRLHTLVDSNDLKDHSTVSLIALAFDWIDDVETIRKRSNLQGVMSKHVKQRLDLFKDLLRVINDQNFRADNPGNLKMRNSRLVADLQAVQDENRQLRQDLVNLQAAVDSLKATAEKQQKINDYHKAMRTAEASVPPILVTPGEDKRSTDTVKIPSRLEEEISLIKSRLTLLESSNKKEIVDETLTDWAPLPQRAPKTDGKPIIKSIIEVKPPRKVTIVDTYDPIPGPSGLGSSFGPVMDVPSGPGSPSAAGPGGPPAADDGPGILGSETEKEKTVISIKKDDGYTTSRDEDSEGWKTVGSKKKAKKKKKKVSTVGQEDKKEDVSSKGNVERKRKTDDTEEKVSPSPKVTNIPQKKKTAMQILKKRVPKSSAVVIKGKTENFSYATALIKLKENISLPEMGIGTTRIKKTAGGAVLIEIPGVDKKKNAEDLRTKAADILGEEATVSRPEMQGEVRIVGFDESVRISDIVSSIAQLGSCEQNEVVVTPIVPMRNGLFMSWVKCPLVSALKVAEAGKMTIGWTVARLELQPPKRQRCFRCWKPGHYLGDCKAEEDFSRACFRCGRSGHVATLCVQEARCILCEKAGLNARHRVGSHVCSGGDRSNDKASLAAFKPKLAPTVEDKTESVSMQCEESNNDN